MSIRKKIAQVVVKFGRTVVLCPNGACSHLGPGVLNKTLGNGMICARCHSPLPRQQSRQITVSPIALLGGTCAGKTVWLLRSLGALLQTDHGQGGVEMGFALPGHEERFSR